MLDLIINPNLTDVMPMECNNISNRTFIAHRVPSVTDLVEPTLDSSAEDSSSLIV